MTNAHNNAMPAGEDDSQFAVLTRFEDVPQESFWRAFCRELLSGLTGPANAPARPRRVLDDGTEPRSRF